MSQFSHLTNSVVENLPHHFDNPKWLIAAGVLAVGAAVAETVQSRVEQKVEKTFVETEEPVLQIADPEIAEGVMAEDRRLSRRDRAAYWFGIGFIGLMGVQEAGPAVYHTKVHGSAAVVMDLGYASNINDMTDGGTRSDDTMAGSLAAANDKNVPFTFILAGNKAEVVDTQPATGKNLQLTKSKLQNALNPVERNGDAVADGVQQAAGALSTTGGSIVIVSSNIADPSEVQALQSIVKKSQVPGAASVEIDAVVVGQNSGSATASVGNAVINSPFNPDAFRQIIGKNNVRTANSAEQVQKGIDAFVERSTTIQRKRTTHAPLVAALASAAGLTILAGRRRLNGTYSATRALRRHAKETHKSQKEEAKE